MKKKTFNIAITSIIVLMFVFIIFQKILNDIRMSSYLSNELKFFEAPNFRSFLGNSLFYFIFAFLCSLRFNTYASIALCALSIVMIPLQLLFNTGSPTIFILIFAILFSFLGFFTARKLKPQIMRRIHS